MSKLFKCTPLVNNAVFNLYTALNTIIDNKLNEQEAADLLFGAVLKTEADFMTTLMFNDSGQAKLMSDYIQDVSLLIQQMVPEISKGLGIKPSSVMALVDNINDSLLLRSEEFNKQANTDNII